MSAFTFGRSTSAAGRDARSLAPRDALLCVDGSGAPAAGLAPGNFKHRLGLAATTALLAMIALLAIGATSAHAAKSPLYDIGTFAAGVGGEQFNAPRGVAINHTGAGGVPTGTVYVVDGGQHRIVSFDADGAFIRAWGRNVSVSETSGDNSASPDFAYEVCVLPSDCTGGGGFATFGGSKGGMFFEARSVAVNQSNGDVYVFDPAGTNRRVQQFDAEGNFIRAWGKDVVEGGGEGPEVCEVAAQCKAGLAGVAAGEFGGTAALAGIAIDAAGNVYVADAANTNKRIQKFDPEGNFLAMGGWNVDSANPSTEYEVCTEAENCQGGTFGAGSGQFGTGSAPSFIAVSPDGDLYAVNAIAGDLKVVRFDEDLALVDPQFAPALVSDDTPRTIAVNPDDGHVFVSKTTLSTIVEIDPDTEAKVTDHSAGHPHWAGLAVNPDSGRAYAASSNTTAGTQGRVLRLLDEGVFPAVVNSASTDVGATGATLRGTVDPNGIELEECFFRYGKTTAEMETIPCAETPAEIGDGTDPVPVQADATGLTSASNYLYRLVAAGPDGSVAGRPNQTFSTPSVVKTDPATEIGASTATLNGRVNPNNEAVTECYFEYGTDSGYGDSVPCAQSQVEIGEGDTMVPVDADLTGLAPGTVHHFRLVIGYAGEPGIAGEDRSFLTFGPVIVATWSEDVALAEARVKAMIDPEGNATTYHFEYGLTDNYGAQTPELTVGSDSDIHTVSRLLQGLEPGTTYHFRVVATNDADGVVVNEGPDRTFATASSHVPGVTCPNQAFRTGASAALPDCRAFEMVSPIDKNGGDIQGALDGAGSTFTVAAFRQASINGGKITYSSATAFGSAPGGHYSNQYIATRTPAGWTTEPISPRRGRTVFEPTNPVFLQDYYFLFSPFQAFSADLSNVWLRDSNSDPLTPDALEGYVNLYRRDNVTGEYETFTSQGPFGRSLLGFNNGITEDGGLRFLGASEDQSQQVYVAMAPLTPDAQQNFENNQLYLWEREPEDARQVLTVRAAIGQYQLGVEKARGIGRVVNGSPLVTELKASPSGGSFEVGDTVSGPAGIPVGTTINAVGPNSLTLSANATASSISEPIVVRNATEPLDVSAEANDVETALEGLEAIGAGNVEVTGGPIGPTGPSPFSISFGGALSKTPIARISVIDLGLSGGVPSTSSGVSIVAPGGHLRLIGVLPSGEPVNNNTFAGISNHDHVVQTRAHRLHNAISEDGSRIFWTASAAKSGAGTLYVRRNPGEEQSARVANACTEPAKACTTPIATNARFWGANEDGSLVLYSQGGESSNTVDTKTLFLRNVDTGVTAQIAPQSWGAAAIADDLSHIYFVSKRALAEGATQGNANLYLYKEGTYTFIAAVPEVDVVGVRQNILGAYSAASGGLVGIDGSGGFAPFPVANATRVTPDGIHFAFMSRSAALSEQTADYDNTDVITGQPAREVYLYAADSGELRCVSCKPSGARPRGVTLKLPYNALDLAFSDFPEERAAASIPTWEHDTHASRLLSYDGDRLFFHSDDALLPQDTNGVQDVYQWQAPGSGSCEVGGNGYSERNGGCIDLISTGRSGAKSEFVDADPLGDEVYFATDQGLDARDPGLRDIYVAKVGGGFALESPTAPCEGEACQSPPPAPEFGSPSSSTFQGAGNSNSSPPARCNRNQVRRGSGCVAKRRLAKKACAKRKGKAKQRCVNKHMRRLNSIGRVGR